MFKSSYNKGFSMTYQNGLTISVQWGVGNYCERRSLTKSFMDAHSKQTVESPNAEIAIWNSKGTMFEFEHDQVKGFVDADEVAQWIELTKNAIHLHHIGHMARMRGMMPPLEEKYVYPSTYKPE